MAFGLLNNKEWKMDLKWNAECDEIETDVVEIRIKWKRNMDLNKI